MIILSLLTVISAKTNTMGILKDSIARLAKQIAVLNVFRS
jgi:hypothetical protein